MTQYTKPTPLPAWAESAGGADVLQPSNAEIQAGWPLTSVPPSRKRFNWILKYLAQGVRYLMQMGIPLWDAAEDYPVNARVMGSDGKTYKALQTSINQNPTTAPTYWQVWGTEGRDNQLQLTTAFTTAGAAPNFTLTPLPAPAALTANLRFRVKFHAAGAGSDVINIAGLGNKSLKQYDSTGAKVAPVIALNQLVDVEYDGVDLVILDPLPPVVSAKQIQTIQATVSANAMTLSLATTTLDFRSATVGSGVVNTRIVPSAISLVIPSGATLATISATLNRLLVLAIDNAGTVELAVYNSAGGAGLDETGVISTTAISGAANALTVYSTTARTNVPYRVVGYVESTQATAGLWASAASAIQGIGGQALAAMSSVGYGQSWVDLTASRTAGVNYYNTTGKPIMVSPNIIENNGSNTAWANVVINGVVAGTISTFGGGNNASGMFVVPPGASYNLTLGVNCNYNRWAELR